MEELGWSQPEPFSTTGFHDVPELNPATNVDASE